MPTRAKYANRQPDICRFLLQHGADVDQIAPVRVANPVVTGTALGDSFRDVQLNGARIEKHTRIPGTTHCGRLRPNGVFMVQWVPRVRPPARYIPAWRLGKDNFPVRLERDEESLSILKK